MNISLVVPPLVTKFHLNTLRNVLRYRPTGTTYCVYRTIRKDACVLQRRAGSQTHANYIFSSRSFNSKHEFSCGNFPFIKQLERKLFMLPGSLHHASSPPHHDVTPPLHSKFQFFV